MNILVTGSNGFIGFHLIKELAKNNKNKIFAIYNKKKPKIFSKNVKFLKIDLTKGILEKKIKFKTHLIYHFANFDTYSLLKDTSKGLILNNLINQNVIFYSKKTNTRLIFSSSSEVTEKKNGLMKETDKIVFYEHFQNKLSYTLSKFIAEFLLFNLNLNNFLIIRLNNVYGPGMKKGQVVKDLILKMSNHKKKITIYNSNSKRNFIFIDDLVKILVKLIKIKPKEKIINLASNETASVKVVAQIIKKKLNKNFKFTYKKSKKNTSNYDKIPDLRLMKKYKLFCRINLNDGIEKFIHSKNYLSNEKDQ